MALMAPIIETARRIFSGRHYTDIRAGEDHQTGGAQLNPPGIDARPLPGDLIAADPSTRHGERVYPGIIDHRNEGKAEEGEIRTYARDASGAVVCEVFCHGDGSIEVTLSPGRKYTIGGASRKAVARDGDTVTLGTPAPPVPPPPAGPLPFWAWVAAVNTLLTGGSNIPPPPTGTTGTIAATSITLEAE